MCWLYESLRPKARPADFDLGNNKSSLRIYCSKQNLREKEKRKSLTSDNVTATRDKSVATVTKQTNSEDVIVSWELSVRSHLVLGSWGYHGWPLIRVCHPTSLLICLSCWPLLLTTELCQKQESLSEHPHRALPCCLKNVDVALLNTMRWMSFNISRQFVRFTYSCFCMHAQQ